MRYVQIIHFIYLFIISFIHSTNCGDNSAFSFNSSNYFNRVNFKWPNTQGFRVLMHVNITSNTGGNPSNILRFTQADKSGGDCHTDASIDVSHIPDQYVGRYVLLTITVTNDRLIPNFRSSIRENQTAPIEGIRNQTLCVNDSADATDEILLDGELTIGQGAEMDVDWIYITNPTLSNQSWYAVYDFSADDPGRDSSGYGNHLSLTGSSLISSDPSLAACVDPCEVAGMSTCAQTYPTLFPSAMPSVSPTLSPSEMPVVSSKTPSHMPVVSPTQTPSFTPSFAPSLSTSTSESSESSSTQTLIVILSVSVAVLMICVFGLYYFMTQGGNGHDESAKVIEFCDIEVAAQARSPTEPGELSSSLISSQQSSGISPGISDEVLKDRNLSEELYRPRPLYLDSSEEGIPKSGGTAGTAIFPRRIIVPLKAETEVGETPKIGEASHPDIYSKENDV